MEWFQLRKYRMIFMDKNKQYWFDVPAYMKVLAEKGYSAEAIKTKMELIVEDTEKLKSERTIARVREYAEGTWDAVKIETIKLIGLALMGDEYAFLEEVNPKNLARILEEGIQEKEDLRKIYRMMRNILSQYEASCAYNLVPSDTKQDAFQYYDAMIEKIREEIVISFMEGSDHRKKLLEILKELECFVKSYSVPGVEQRWREIAPEIGYFDCVYDIMEESPEAFLMILKGEGLRFSFIPTPEEIQARKKYFDRIQKQNYIKNLKYSEERIFQNELLLTFEKVFVHDFPELKERL